MPGGTHGKSRAWEIPLAGHVFELNGPDADGVAMPPAPKLGSPGLVAEMAEAYAMALGDVPFGEYHSDSTVADACAMLGQLPSFLGSEGDATDNHPKAARRSKIRRRARFARVGAPAKPYHLTPQNIVRGSTPGAHRSDRRRAGAGRVRR